jgi:aminopeptidase-like protein
MQVNSNIDNSQQLGLELYRLMSDLYPICRSITGDGVRKSLHLLQQYIPLEMHEVPTGTTVFDWTVPKEWNVRDAYVKTDRGQKVIDFQVSNLHLLNYSTPIHERMPLARLQEHLYSLPEHPDWIPYRTSYYQEAWGFCVSDRVRTGLADGEYEVYIDSALTDGHLTYGEYYLPGETEAEVLFSCHVCHPSLCNDNLSGVVVATFLAQMLETLPRRYSYRFLFVPGTIGSITWLALNASRTDRIAHGLVISGVGDAGAMTYKKSRRGNAQIDRIVAHVLQHAGKPYSIQEFSPYGYDERQYCSPGFNLPVGRLGRTPFGKYPEYHTSADNLDFVKPETLADSFAIYTATIDTIERDRIYINTNPYCEPQLGKRGLYKLYGGMQTTEDDRMALLWVLNLSDGQHSLLDIADRSGLDFQIIAKAASALAQQQLLQPREASILENPYFHNH